MTNSLFIGIDVSLKSNQVCVMNFDQKVFLNSSFPNTPAGSELLVSKLKDLHGKYYFDHFIFVAESTGVYNFHVACFLASNEFLNNFNSFVYCVNAKDILNYKKSFNSLEKTDHVDAYVIADFARVGRTKNLHPFRGSQFIALQRLTRQRFHISKSLIREKTYVLNNIYLSFSGLVSATKEDKPFSNIFGASATSFLEDFLSPDQIAESSLEELIAFISLKGKNRFKNPSSNANLLSKAIRASYRLDKTQYEPINIAIASSLNTIRFLDKQIKEIDKAILNTVLGLDSNTYNVLLSIRGIGKAYAAGIMAEIGSIDFFSHNSKFAKYAGLYWNRNQSGGFESDNTKLSHCSNKYLRYYIIEAASSCVRTNFPFIKNFYDIKYKEVNKHQHKRALVLSARKLVRLIFGLLRKNQYYIPILQESNNLSN